MLHLPSDTLTSVVEDRDGAVPSDQEKVVSLHLFVFPKYLQPN